MRLRSFTDILAEDIEAGIGEKGFKRKQSSEALDISLEVPNRNQRLRTTCLGPVLKKRYLEWTGVA